MRVNYSACTLKTFSRYKVFRMSLHLMWLITFKQLIIKKYVYMLMTPVENLKEFYI